MSAPWTFARAREASADASRAQKAAELMAKFWARVEVGAPDECWPWTGAIVNGGYGRIHGPTYGHNLAHRYALAASGVDVSPDAHVLHSCDNPPCCNPAHLRLGTNAENVSDRVTRGRSADVAGESNPFARLTATQVADIRRRLAAGHLQHDVAAAFGVSQTTVSRIGLGKTWRCV